MIYPAIHFLIVGSKDGKVVINLPITEHAENKEFLERLHSTGVEPTSSYYQGLMYYYPDDPRIREEFKKELEVPLKRLEEEEARLKMIDLKYEEEARLKRIDSK